jgi:hypothetical protein
MEETKTNFNWKRLLITTVLVLVASGAVGGTTYYVLNSNFQKERDASEKALQDLQLQVKKQTTEEKTETPASTQEEIASNVFNVATAKAGDRIGSMTISSVKTFSSTLQAPGVGTLSKDNAKITFSGEVKITGEYKYQYDAFGDAFDLIFIPSEEAYKVLPVIKGAEDHKIPIWFSNKAEALKLLGITTGVAKTGTVTITISNYVMNRYPTEVRDSFALVKVN